MDEVDRQSNKRTFEGGRSQAGAASKVSKVDRHGESESGVLGKRDASKLCEVAEEEGSSSDVKKRRQNLTAADVVSPGASHGSALSTLDAALADPRLAEVDPSLTRMVCAAMFGRDAMFGQRVSTSSKDALVKICARLEEEGIRVPEDLEDQANQDFILEHIKELCDTKQIKYPDYRKFQKVLSVFQLQGRIEPRLQKAGKKWEDGLVFALKLTIIDGIVEDNNDERIERV